MEEINIGACKETMRVPKYMCSVYYEDHTTYQFFKIPGQAMHSSKLLYKTGK
jgi:hypothetical protein